MVELGVRRVKLNSGSGALRWPRSQGRGRPCLASQRALPCCAALCCAELRRVPEYGGREAFMSREAPGFYWVPDPLGHPPSPRSAVSSSLLCNGITAAIQAASSEPSCLRAPLTPHSGTLRAVPKISPLCFPLFPFFNFSIPPHDCRSIHSLFFLIIFLAGGGCGHARCTGF